MTVGALRLVIRLLRRVAMVELRLFLLRFRLIGVGGIVIILCLFLRARRMLLSCRAGLVRIMNLLVWSFCLCVNLIWLRWRLNMLLLNR